MERKVFISYSRRDLKIVKKIKEQIENSCGTNCWMDLEGIESGNPEFTKAIVDGINECQIFLFMLSNNSQDSTYALGELNLAYKKSKESNGKKNVVMVNIDNCAMRDDFYLLYSRADVIDWDKNSQRDKFLRDIVKWTGSKTIENRDEKKIKKDKIAQKSVEEKADVSHNLKVKVDVDCIFYIDGVEKAKLIHGKIEKFALQRGEYELRFVSSENPAVYVEQEFEMPNFDKLLKITLNDMSEERPSSKTEEWYKKGEDYYYGQNGRDEDHSEAVRWFHKAAEQGHVEAQYLLGNCYYEEMNYSEAAKWYQEIAEQGHEDAQRYLADCYYNIGENFYYGLDENTEDYSEAVKWYRKAAELGHSEAQFSLGSCYYSGTGIEEDDSEAVKWFSKAAVQGNASAQFLLGSCYESGIGVEEDNSKAVKWYQKAAEQNYAPAQYNLGECYYSGIGVVEDYSEAVMWFRKAAEQDNADAQCSLGCCYYNGDGVEQDYSKAVKWLRKAAKQGEDTAQFILGCCYYNGEGVQENDMKAEEWWRKSAENGNEDAIEKLEECFGN